MGQPTAYWQEYAEYIKARGNIDEVMIVAADDGALYASSDPANFYLRTYSATIMQEDGSEREETVNEAQNVVTFMKGKSCSQGLRINQKKMQVTRNFVEDSTGLQMVYGKIPMGGACVANAGKAILIGTFSELKQHTSPQCNEVITLMAYYLSKSTWPSGSESSSGGDKGGASGGATNWQQHVDKALVARGNIAEAMLVDKDTGKVLASTPNFTLQVYEAEIAQEDGTDVTQTVNEANNVKQLMQKSKPAQGLRVNQVKYQIIRSFEEESSGCYSVYGKKALGGIAVVNAGKVIVIATFDEKLGHVSPACNEHVQELAKYLKDAVK